MNCPTCNHELVTDDDQGLKKVFLEHFKLSSSIGGIAKGLWRFCNVWRGYISSSVLKSKGYLYCPKCQTYKIQCPNCWKYIDLGKTYPMQGDVYTCGACKREFVWYFENDNEDMDFEPGYRNV